MAAERSTLQRESDNAKHKMESPCLLFLRGLRGAKVIQRFLAGLNLGRVREGRSVPLLAPALLMDALETARGDRGNLGTPLMNINILLPSFSRRGGNGNGT